jgi:hypothetical protein
MTHLANYYAARLTVRDEHCIRDIFEVPMSWVLKTKHPEQNLQRYITRNLNACGRTYPVIKYEVELLR